MHSSGHSSPYHIAFMDQFNYLKFQAGDSAPFKKTWLYAAILIIIIPIVSVLIWRQKRGFSSMGKRKVQSLSSQEKRVFNLLKEGKSNKEISSELHIEVSTVKSHLHKIYSRLGVKSRKEIVDEAT